MQAAFPADILLPQTPKRLVVLPLKPSSLLASTTITIRPRLISLRITGVRVRASSGSPSPSSPPPAPKAQPFLLSLLKPACVTLATAAALLAAGLHMRTPRAAYALPSPSSVAAEEQSKTEAPLTEEEKESILEEHLDLHPDDVRSLRALMELRAKAGRYAEAVEVIDRLVLLEPGDKDLLLLKAHLQSHAGDMEAAKEGFEALIREDPFHVEAYHGLVMTAAAETTEDAEEVEMLEGIVRRIDSAVEACKKEKRKEASRDFRLLVAQVRVMEGRYDEALKVYQELVREEPRDFRPYLCQGIVYSVLRRKEDAEKQFDKYRRLVPRGHPYARYFEDNVTAMKVFGQMDENNRAAASAALSR